VQRLLAIAIAASLALAASTTLAQDFAPNPRQAFQGFAGINPPRAEVPVGALWVNEYGPIGEGASIDNLETVRSLSSVSIDKNLQLALTVGLLNLLGIDPSARSHYTAHFSDLAIIRVKDPDKLPGVKGEPRILEALKAGSVSVSSDSDLGLNGQKAGWQSSITGTMTGERSRSFSIEAHDMFIAIHVATPERTTSAEKELRISDDGKSARLDGFLLVISRDHCSSSRSLCLPQIGIAKLNSETVSAVEPVQLPSDGRAELKLPVPVSDGEGGLYDKLELRWVFPCADRKADGCGKQPRLTARYEGTRLVDFASPRAKNW
jgi:hypothetical protein